MYLKFTRIDHKDLGKIDSKLKINLLASKNECLLVLTFICLFESQKEKQPVPLPLQSLN